MINLMLIGITTAQHAAIVCKISHAPLLPCPLQSESCYDLSSQLLKDPCLLLLDHELLNVCEAGKDARLG
jgi:hypothetical protein